MVQSPVDEAARPPGGLFVVRLVIALVQAWALYGLAEATTEPIAWPATVPVIFTPLLMVFALTPLAAVQGLGRIGTRPLVFWCAAAAAILALLGYYDAWRGEVPATIGQDRFWPHHQLVWAVMAALFVAHALVVDSVIERRLMPAYPRHFDTAWKQGLQVALTIFFVALFWGLLHLGAKLFKLVRIDQVETLIEKRWFAIPATTLAIATAIHVTDVQPALIRGARSVVLTLTSWLLPLFAALMLAFLASLPFTTLKPLWETHFAADLLLTAAGAIVFLVNTCYQDGAEEQTRSRIKRLAVMLGAVELVPLTGLAAWALALRVGDYGWTTERVFAAAVIAVAACYALGYAGAALSRSGWMRRLETVNFATAYVALALFLLLFSPILDPARIMVANQLARLKSGAVTAAEFDFAALKFDGARWGTTALAELAKTDGPGADLIRHSVAVVQAASNRWAARTLAPDAAGRIKVYPEGRELPPNLLDGDVEGIAAACRFVRNSCAARYITLRDGDREALILVSSYSGGLFQQDDAGHWHETAELQGLSLAKDAASPTLAVPVGTQPHDLPDLKIGDQRVTLVPKPAGR